MDHQRRPLSKEATIERKHKSARYSSFFFPNLCSIQVIKENFDNDKVVSCDLVSPDTNVEEIVSLNTINLQIATMYQPKFLKPMLFCFQILHPMLLINPVIFLNFFFYHLENS